MRYGLALIGFGGVNRALVQIIYQKQKELKQKFGLTLSIVSISDMFQGQAFDRQGLNLETLVNLPLEKGVLASLPGGGTEADNMVAICADGVDIVAEATFTNSVDGEPAVSHCRTAFDHGKHIVTTNKGPVALFGDELCSLAQEKNLGFEFEGTVMSGTPVLSFAKATLKGCTINSFRGILNGTANFVLGLVEGGANMVDAIRQAQEMGYAEADPTADIEGFDVMLKVVILANQLFDAGIKPEDVIREGISGLSEEKIRSALGEGKKWKLIGQATRDGNGKLVASVTPQCLPMTDTLAGVSGATNAIALDTDMLGSVMVSGPGAGRIETGYALLADILNIHEKFGAGEG